VQAEGKGERCGQIRIGDIGVGKKPFDHCTKVVNFMVLFSPLDSTLYTLQYAASLTHLAVLLLLPPPLPLPPPPLMI